MYFTAQDAAKLSDQAYSLNGFYARQQTIQQLDNIKYVASQGRRETLLISMAHEFRETVIRRLRELGYMVEYIPPSDRWSEDYKITW